MNYPYTLPSRHRDFKTILTLTLAVVAISLTSQGASRERIPLNQGWKFLKGDSPETAESDRLTYDQLKPYILSTAAPLIQGMVAKRPQAEPPQQPAYAQAGFDDGGWRKLDLPHDWAIEGPFDIRLPGKTGKLPYAGVGWYRNELELALEDSGKQICIEIDGAMSYSQVWCNGHLAGGWPNGYTSYRVNLTPWLKMGQRNTIAIRLETLADSSRWYPGAGIYRNVWLVKMNPVHVAHWGTFVTTPTVSPKESIVEIETSIENQAEKAIPVEVKTEIFESNRLVASSSTVKLLLQSGTTGKCSNSIKMSQPQLWSVETPHLYRAVTSISRNGSVLDCSETTFGIRNLEFSAVKGFLLNGKRVPINGACMHHDLGALGTAFNTSAAKRQLEILKEMGCNAIRTSHNPPAPELLDLCDQMGFLVMDESFDCWRAGKTTNDYHLLWADWHEADLRAQVRRDRNHPSVILWSIGNEIRSSDEDMEARKELVRIVTSEDPTRPATEACANSKMGFSEIPQIVGVFGYNYKPKLYSDFLKKNPGVPLFGSETSSTVSSRGEYFFPINSQGANYQVNSYDRMYMPWATSPDMEFAGQDMNPSVMGEFVWTGFDYIGEPTPYNHDSTVLLNFSSEAEKHKMEREMQKLDALPVASRSSYFGIVDLCGFRKDRFYLYQSRWRPELPMAHLMPHWNWPERIGQSVPVQLYTSGDEAELFVNGKSMGRRKRMPVVNESGALDSFAPVTTTASSSKSGSNPSMAFDGDLKTTWFPATGSSAPWCQVDWGAEKEVRKIELQLFGKNPTCEFEVLLSKDGKNWESVAEKKNNRRTRGALIFKADAKARYARLVLTGKKSDEEMGVCDLRASTRPPVEEAYRLLWDTVIYQPGEIKAVVYKDGKPWAEDSIRTTGPARAISMKPDHGEIRGDGRELSYVTVSLTDEKGQVVPRSKNKIHFEVTGPGEIVATDNGDATDLTVFSDHDRKAFNGYALVILRAFPGKTGEIKLRATSPSLAEAVTSVELIQ